MISQGCKQDMVKEMDVDMSSLEPLEEVYKNALAALKTDLEVSVFKMVLLCIVILLFSFVNDKCTFISF